MVFQSHEVYVYQSNHFGFFQNSWTKHLFLSCKFKVNLTLSVSTATNNATNRAPQSRTKSFKNITVTSVKISCSNLSQITSAMIAMVLQS